MRIQNQSFAINLDVQAAAISFEGAVDKDRLAGKTVGDMKHLFYHQDIDSEEKLYDFYLGVAKQSQKAKIQRAGLRYDLILLQAGQVRTEYKKTSGHRHAASYPEIYEVLHGEALFMLQKSNQKDVAYFAAVRASAGEKILIPPGYTHATVNIGAQPLLFADLVADVCENCYEDVSANHGLCYYVLNREDQITFVKNDNYGSVPPARIIRPVSVPKLGLTAGVPVYDVLSRDPDVYEYLVRPKEYSSSICYLADIIEERMDLY